MWIVLTAPGDIPRNVSQSLVEHFRNVPKFGCTFLRVDLSDHLVSIARFVYCPKGVTIYVKNYGGYVFQAKRMYIDLIDDELRFCRFSMRGTSHVGEYVQSYDVRDEIGFLRLSLLRGEMEDADGLIYWPPNFYLLVAPVSPFGPSWRAP